MFSLLCHLAVRKFEHEKTRERIDLGLKGQLDLDGQTNREEEL